MSELNGSLDGIEIRKAKGVTIRFRVNWDKVGDKYSAEFLKSVRQNNFATTMLKHNDNGGIFFT